MRIFSTSTKRVIDRDHAWRCLAVNVGLTPGLGSLMARRWVIGLMTLALAVAGFFLFTAGMWHAFKAALNSSEPNTELMANAGPVLRGFAIFLAAWVMGAIDSWLILRGSQKVEPLPPIIRQPL